MVTYTQEYVDRCLKQHKAHSKNLTNGDHLIHIQGGLYDLFVGKGFSTQIRFRMVHLKQNNSHQIIQLSGPTLSREYRTQLHKELSS